ncbi:hypothetical protein [Streptomyces mirabilis]|uniref:hypothetical protein n=1 Tax=Streptomyces mirabilis TaxID=68239 RepID=UPI002250BA85|nr:hypothetical protein [Streptomyces mirabilis]MCX4608701.1 hypothetical protein [Streptomyces mirabilis]
MSLSPNSSGRDVSGRITLQESSERIESAHLVEIAQRMVQETRATNEGVIAWQLVTHPFLSGTRGIARWSDMHKETVQHIVGPEGRLSAFKFLWTRTRGTSSPLADERDSLVIRFHSNTRTVPPSTPPENLQAPGPLGDLALEGEESSWWSNGRNGARISEGAQGASVEGMKTLRTLTTNKGMGQAARTLRALDASLDVWSESRGPEAPEFALGRQAWKLAVLSGLRDVVLTVADIEVLCGLSKRGAQDLLARMTKALPGLVQKVRQGRSFVYEVAWAQVFDQAMGELYDDRVGRHEVRDRRAVQDKAEQVTAARRGTGAGFIAYRFSMANPKQDEYLAANPLAEDADPVWRELVERGDELALYEYLRAQEDEAGAVPATVEELVTPSRGVASTRPAQESAVVQEDPELLARVEEMRRRIVAGSYA